MGWTEIKSWQCVCDKCRHEWVSRNQRLPRICANCKSSRWNDGDRQKPTQPEPQPEFTDKVEPLDKLSKSTVKAEYNDATDSVEYVEQKVVYDEGYKKRRIE